MPTMTDAPKNPFGFNPFFAPEQVKKASEQAMNLWVGALSPMWVPFLAASGFGLSAYTAGKALQKDLLDELPLAGRWPGFAPLWGQTDFTPETFEEPVETVAEVVEAAAEPVVEAVDAAVAKAEAVAEPMVEAAETAVAEAASVVAPVIDPVIEAPVVPAVVEAIAETPVAVVPLPVVAKPVAPKAIAKDLAVAKTKTAPVVKAAVKAVAKPVAKPIAKPVAKPKPKAQPKN